MSGILFGIGKVPTTTLDVSGNALITRNLTVSGTATLSSAILTNLTVSGTTNLSALTTSSFRGAGLTTLSSLLVQDTISSSNVYISGTTLGLKLETNVPLTMNSMFSNQGTNILGGTSVTTLNSLTWPTGTQAVGSVLTICAGATSAYWAVPGAVSLSGWWNVAPNAILNMNNNGITNLPSINGTQINLNSTYDFIGIGRGALTGSIGGSNIVAIGVSAGIGSTGTNVIYLGTNPGGTHPYSNWFTVYSTTSGLPFLQGDMANMRLGIGKTPLSALDVSGSAFVSQSLNVSGFTTLSNITSTTLSASSIYSSGTINSSGTATLNAVSIPTTLGVTGTSTLGTTGTGALTASSITTGGTLGVTGQTNLTSAVLSSTLNVTGTSTLGRVDAGQITGSSLISTGGLTATGGTSTLGTTNVGALSVTGTSSLGTTTASTLTATNLVAQGTLNAVGATSTLGATTVNTTLNVCGAANLSSAILSQNLTVCGQTLFKNLSFTSLNSLTWNSPEAGDTVLSVNSARSVLSWVSLTSVGLQNWAQNVANSTISLQGLYGITGITTFNNISAVFVSALAQVGLGSGVLLNNPASNIVAFGINAGAVVGNPEGYSVYSNNMFLGSNPGGSCNVSNSLVVYSQTAGSPLIYGDLSKNQVAIAGQSTGGYTLNVNGSAQASRFASPAASSNSIGGVTMSNSILTVGTVCNVTNLNGQTLRIDGTTGLIGIGPNMNLGGTFNIAIGNYAGYNYTQTGILGGQLIAIGGWAGYGSSGYSNTLLGFHAGESNTGSFVNAVGYYAGESNKGSYVNALGSYAAWSNTASYVDAIGVNAANQNVSTGSNLVAIGSNAGYGNRGASNIYIGTQAGNGSSVTAVINAIVIGGGAGVAGGVYAVGTRSIMIGTGSTAGGSDSIAIGTASLAGNSANIAIGANAGYNGPSSIVIGSNTGSSPNTSATNVIAIGTNAASNIPALNNTIYIGSNAGYNPTTANTLVIHSTLSTAPTLQADLSRRCLGVGGAPSYNLDVQVTSAGSNGMRIAQNNATGVSAGLFLEAGLGTGGNVISNSTLVSFATRGLGGGTIVQSLMSIYEGNDYGISIKAGNTVSSSTILRVTTSTNQRVGVGTVSPATTLDVSGTFNVSGATTLSGVTIGVLNGVRWPTTAGAVNNQLVISDTGQASWAAPGQIDSAKWSLNPALQAVNMAGFGLTGLASINGLTTTIASTNNQIGIGANVLANNTAANVVAFGSNAGSNATGDSTWSNCVYLGANPGTIANGANTFLVYSTTATIPAIQVNMESRRLGVGMVPANALDVSGAARISTTLTSIGNVTIGTIASPSNYSLNINGATDTGGMIAFYNTAANPQPQFGIGFDKAAGGFALKANLGGTDFTGTAMFVTAGGRVGVGTITPAYTLDVAGQINTNTAVSTPSLTVTTSTVLRGTLSLPTIASTTYANGVLSYNSTTGAVTQSTLSLGTLGAADSNIMNANWVTSGGGLITWNATTGVVSGTARLIAIPVNGALSTDGHFTIASGNWSITVGAWSAAYWVPSSVPTSSTVAGSFQVVTYRADMQNPIMPNWIFICCTNNETGVSTLKWGPGFITIPPGGVFNSFTGGTSWNVLGTATNIALGSNSSITGAKSIVIGSNTEQQNILANNVIAIGTNAGSNLENLNNTIYIGSNAGYRPGVSNTLVVHSTSSTAPTLQADLANRRLGVGIAPSYALDVAGTIRASGPVISTLNVAGITSGTSITLTTDNATTYYSLTTTTGTTLTLTLPSTAPPQGTYWVLKNNAAVNYTLNSTNGVFNAGSNSYYLQAGIGITLAYSGTQANGSNAYYTF